MCSCFCCMFIKNTDEKILVQQYNSVRIKKGAMMEYFSKLAIPFTIFYILFCALKEKINTFDVFLEGAKEGIEIVVKIFPTLVGLFVAIGVLRSSGVIDCIIKILYPITKVFKIPTEIMPLALLRPISRKCFSCSRCRYNEDIWRR